MKPRLLDLYSGAGGCARGYQEAGFEVTGVDIESQPNYVGDRFWLADALDYLELLMPVIGGFQAIHASPPCQAHSDLQKQSKREYPELIAPTRELLRETGLPYVIENVEGAPLIEPTMLCGSGFGLPLRRHRLFETNFPLMSPGCSHGGLAKRFKVFRHGEEIESPFVPVYGTGGGKAAEHWEEAMGIDWMTRAEMAQAIPPAFTRHVGEYLMTHLSSTTQQSPMRGEG